MSRKLIALTLLFIVIGGAHLALLSTSGEYQGTVGGIVSVWQAELIPILVPFIGWGLIALIVIHQIGQLIDRRKR